MKPIHFITIMRFAKDNNLMTNSFDSVVATIEIKAKARGVSVEEFLEQYNNKRNSKISKISKNNINMIKEKL